MAQCQALVEAIRGGEERQRWAVATIYRDPTWRDIAWKNYRRYARHRAGARWDDFFTDVVRRFAVSVERTPTVADCSRHFHQICKLHARRDYCVPQSEKGVSRPPIADLFDRLAPCFERLSARSKLLLDALYLRASHIHSSDDPRLIDELRRHGYGSETASVATLHVRSLVELRRLAGDRLDDFISPDRPFRK